MYRPFKPSVPAAVADLEKANQDSFMVCEKVLGDPNCNIFGVFDGHGQYGDLCSHFTASNVRIMLGIVVL